MRRRNYSSVARVIAPIITSALALLGLAVAPSAGAVTPSAGAVTPLSVSTTTLVNGAVGSAYSTTLSATGGTKPYRWKLVGGGVPNGLTLSSTGVISGTPTLNGKWSLSPGVVDGSGHTASRALTLKITVPIAINTTALPNGLLGTAYSSTLVASGGTAPYTWKLAAGGVPDGLSLSTTGTISGTPTRLGKWSLTPKVTDATGHTSTRALTLKITPAWTSSTIPVPSGVTGARLIDISCVGTTFCVATGESDQAPFLETLSGGTWTYTARPNDPEDPNLMEPRYPSVSCPAIGVCVAVGVLFTGPEGSAPFADRLSGGTWTRTELADPVGGGGFAAGANAVSCATTSNCTLVGTFNNLDVGDIQAFAMTLANGGWTQDQSSVLAGHSSADQISCAAAGACAAIADGSVIQRTPSGWSDTPLVTPAGATSTTAVGVSCPTATACNVTGYYTVGNGDTHPLIESWSSGAWHIATITDPSGAVSTGLQDISCSSAGSCVALGQGGVTVTLSGGTWTLVAASGLPDIAADAASRISCPTASTCLAVGLDLSGAPRAVYRHG
ncbi:MAG: hypothetical protein JWM76_3287 [Pseudonocardiales bacterium]|nr:hypothetical protein [Pseudonocardiales bacterium]